MKMSSNEILFKNSKLNGDDTSTNDEDDVWDDTLLIEAYDKAVQLAHNEVLKNMDVSPEKSKSKKKSHQWSTGDKCRCEYSEDHTYYEADIIDIIDDVGMCIVKYVGYGNEEKVPLSKLKQSKGEVQRAQQMKQAMLENNISDETAVERESGSKSYNQPSGKKKSSKAGKSKSKESRFHSADHSINADTPQMPQPPSMNMSIPPPPPPHLFGNMSDDVTESEAMSAMLMSWYMSGYHTGYYQGLRAARKK